MSKVRPYTFSFLFYSDNINKKKVHLELEIFFILQYHTIYKRNLIGDGVFYRFFEGRRSEDIIGMKVLYFVVVGVDGDYADLQRREEGREVYRSVARYLLPNGAGFGSRLKFEAGHYLMA